MTKNPSNMLTEHLKSLDETQIELLSKTLELLATGVIVEQKLKGKETKSILKKPD